MLTFLGELRDYQSTTSPNQELLKLYKVPPNTYNLFSESSARAQLEKARALEVQEEKMQAKEPQLTFHEDMVMMKWNHPCQCRRNWQNLKSSTTKKSGMGQKRNHMKCSHSLSSIIARITLSTYSEE